MLEMFLDVSSVDIRTGVQKNPHFTGLELFRAVLIRDVEGFAFFGPLKSPTLMLYIVLLPFTGISESLM